MDSLKEIFDSLNQRIKSPFWGYIIIAFAGVNWKPLYYLFFSGEPALMKFNYFDENSDCLSLAIYPVIIGVATALAAPYIADFGSWWAKKPTNSWRLRHVEASHEILQAKNKLLIERDNAKAIHEQSLIDQARRDEAVKGIEDDQLRENLEEEISASRAAGDVTEKPDTISFSGELSAREQAVISSMGKAGRKIQILILGDLENIFVNEIGKVIGDLTAIRLEVELEDSLVELQKLGLATKDGNAEWSLTTAGYSEYDKLS